MSEQEIRNLQKELIALTASVNEIATVAKKAAEVAYLASDKSNKMAEANQLTLKGIQTTLAPIADIYSGAGVVWTVVKYLILGATVVVGLILSFKKLLK